MSKDCVCLTTLSSHVHSVIFIREFPEKRKWDVCAINGHHWEEHAEL